MSQSETRSVEITFLYSKTESPESLAVDNYLNKSISYINKFKCYGSSSFQTTEQFQKKRLIL